MVWERSGLVKKWEFHDWLGCGESEWEGTRRRELEEGWTWDPGQKWICCVFCWDAEIKCFVAFMMFDYGGGII
jgi:hypothetical protein